MRSAQHANQPAYGVDIDRWAHASGVLGQYLRSDVGELGRDSPIIQQRSGPDTDALGIAVRQQPPFRFCECSVATITMRIHRPPPLRDARAQSLLDRLLSEDHSP